jgi:hypothetical protein
MAFGVGVALINVLTFIVGGVFILLGFGRSFVMRIRQGRWSTSKGLYVFATAVCLEIIGEFVAERLPDGMINREFSGVVAPKFISSVSMIMSFMLLWVSLLVAKRGSDSERTIVMAGAVILIVIYIFGFVVIVVG